MYFDHRILAKSNFNSDIHYSVGHEGYKAYLRNQRVLHPATPGVTASEVSDARSPTGVSGSGGYEIGRLPALEDYRSVMAQRAVFQGLASMGLPAFTIHSIVRYSGRALKDAKNKTIRTYGPIGVSPVLKALPSFPLHD